MPGFRNSGSRGRPPGGGKGHYRRPGEITEGPEKPKQKPSRFGVGMGGSFAKGVHFGGSKKAPKPAQSSGERSVWSGNFVKQIAEKIIGADGFKRSVKPALAAQQPDQSGYVYVRYAEDPTKPNSRILVIRCHQGISGYEYRWEYPK